MMKAYGMIVHGLKAIKIEVESSILEAYLTAM